MSHKKKPSMAATVKSLWFDGAIHHTATYEGNCPLCDELRSATVVLMRSMLPPPTFLCICQAHTPVREFPIHLKQ